MRGEGHVPFFSISTTHTTMPLIPLSIALEVGAVGVGVLLLAAAVGYEWRRDAPTAIGWALIGAGGALALGVASRHVACAAVRVSDGLILAYVAVGLAASAAAGVVATFAIAYVCGVVILLPLFVARRADLVAYDPTSPHFVVSRAAAYATLCALGRWLEERGSLAPTPARLLPLAASTVETVVMYALGTRAYAFPPHSRSFAAYALLKASIFLALPRVDHSLADAR